MSPESTIQIPPVYQRWVRLGAKRTVVSFVLVLSLFVAISAVLTVQGATAASALHQDADFAAIDAYVAGQVRDLRIPGLALGIVQGDQIVHLQGFGVADDSGRQVTPQTPFHIASLGKSFTARAVMQLVEAGEIELDAPVQRYLPWFRVADEAASAEITVRHLLNQTSGIPSVASDMITALQHSGEDAIEQNVRGLSSVELAQPVGTGYEYANVNYSTLGLIVQTVSGEPYAQYIEQHIFAPLEMNYAYMDRTQDSARGAAVGHAYWFGFPRPAALPFFPGDRPAGADSFIASAEDMSHYLIAQLNGGRYGSHQLLSPEGIALLHQPTTPTNTPGEFYGMGWESRMIDDIPVVRHDGGIFVYYSEMALVPDQDWGVIMLVNTVPILQAATGDERITAIVPGVINLLHGRQPVTPLAGSGLWLIYVILFLPVLIQTIGIVRSLMLLRRWQLQPARRPIGRRRTAHIWLPLIVNLLWAFVILVGIPAPTGASLSVLAYQFPDVVAVLRVSAAVALVWGILRTAWGLLVLRAADKPIDPSLAAGAT